LSPTAKRDPLRLALEIFIYVVLFYLILFVFGGLLVSLGGLLAGTTIATLAAAVFANWLALRIWTARHIFELGLWWNQASSENLGFGLLGGAAAAVIVLTLPLLSGAAHFAPASPADRASPGSLLFIAILLAAGAIGEELFFRGYGFQVMLANLGPYATVIPVGILFALGHGNNPNASWWGIGNTAGFGILFGYAYLRSRDLWLPIGLHLGWNFTLPLFGVNLSGLRMRVTGYEMAWTAGPLWSGGEYGPEGSVLTSMVVLLLAVYLAKAPIRRQPSPLTDPPAENAV
jgi:uncharacterized protein